MPDRARLLGSSTARRLAGIGREALLTLAAVAGAGCLLVGVGAAVFGVSTYVVQSGSMAPSIQAGDVVITKQVPAADLEVSDVVTVQGSDGSRVTHRITRITSMGDIATLTLKGDANEQTDDATYRVGSADRVMTHVPKVGYAVGWLQTPAGLGLLGFVVVSAAASLLIPKRREILAVSAAAALVAGLVAARGAPSATAAYFTDNAAVKSGALSAATVAPVGDFSCTGGLGAVVTWPGNPLYDYETLLRRVDTGEMVAGSARQITGTASSVNYVGLLDFGVLGTGVNRFNVEVRARLVAAPTWISAVRTYASLEVAGLLVQLTVACKGSP